MFKQIQLKTNTRTEFINITSKVNQVVSSSGYNSGIVVVSVPHTTAAVTINENADSDVQKDILAEINKVIPFDDNYSHFEGNSAAHIKSSLFGCSETIIIEDGKMVLGRWQGLYFCEFDGPRTRKLNIKIIES